MMHKPLGMTPIYKKKTHTHYDSPEENEAEKYEENNFFLSWNDNEFSFRLILFLCQF
jgi:hypothetical protein